MIRPTKLIVFTVFILLEVMQQGLGITLFLPLAVLIVLSAQRRGLGTLNDLLAQALISILVGLIRNTSWSSYFLALLLILGINSLLTKYLPSTVWRNICLLLLATAIYGLFITQSLSYFSLLIMLPLNVLAYLGLARYETSSFLNDATYRYK